MDLSFTKDEREFQQEVRQFLKENLPEAVRVANKNNAKVFVDKDIALQWQQVLVEKGWAVPQWPVEHGGTGWSPAQKYIFSMECYRAGAPMLIPLGLLMLAPVIMAFGTEAQKAEYLPKILSGEHYWCQGYSEPGAGSDLARLQLKAESCNKDGELSPSGDYYRINGSKIWTTHAHFADHIFCLVRTDATGKPQHGISFLLIEMSTAGVKVDPIITMANDHEVNQVFFDDVVVAKSNRIGEEGKGWTYAKYLLEFERGGGFSAHRLWYELDELKAMVDETAQRDAYFSSQSNITRKIARLEIDVKALEITELRILSSLSNGGNPGAESSLMKLTTTTLEQKIHELAVEVAGYHGFAMSQEAQHSLSPANTVPIVPRYLNSRASSIFGGSSEVQKNIIAKMVLGL